jgi:hypothetical protein
MENHLTGRSTVLRFDSHQFGVSLSADDFTSAALERR